MNAGGGVTVAEKLMLKQVDVNAEAYGLELEHVNWMLKQLDWMLGFSILGPHFWLFCKYVGLLGMWGWN